MDSPHADGFTTDELTTDKPNPRYCETGLQTSNKPSEGGPSGSDSMEQQTDPVTANRKRRQVTDPVTHLTVSIHDTTDKELERIPPPPASPQEQPKEENARREDSDRRHDAMDNLVERETKGRWEDREEKIQKGRVMAACVAGTATVGATTVMFLWALVVAGSEGIGLKAAEVVIGIAGCVVMGAATVVVVWIFTATQPEQDGGFDNVLDKVKN
jgi:hypothetical protein